MPSLLVLFCEPSYLAGVFYSDAWWEPNKRGTSKSTLDIQLDRITTTQTIKDGRDSQEW